MFTIRRSILFPALVALASATSMMAQPAPGTDRQMLDGVAAVVGNEVVLISDVMQRAAMQRQSTRPEDLDPSLLREMRNALIDEKLVLTRAREDSIVVSEEEVTAAVENQIEYLKQQFGGEAGLVRTYKMTIDQLRREAREIIRQQLLSQKVLQQRFAGLKVTERDLQEFYQLYKDSIPQVPEQFELQQIVLLAKPSSDAVASTISLANRLIDSIKAGGDFADFAKRYSTDPGSASRGGDYGYVPNGKFVREYDSATAALGVNEISGPVRTQFGIHIIQVLGKRPNEVHSRHILLRLNQTTAERDSMIALLGQLRSRALAGESFDSLARRFSQDEETAPLGGYIGKATAEQLPNDMRSAVTALKEGEITQPLPAAISATESGYRIVRLSRRIPAHMADPVSDRLELEELARRYKQRKEYANWVAELRKEIYWEIKSDF